MNEALAGRNSGILAFSSYACIYGYTYSTADTMKRQQGGVCTVQRELWIHSESKGGEHSGD
jgi:hypothetical protein